MTLVKVAIVLALAVVSADVDAQTQFNTRAVVERLASDEFEGRLTGSEGIRKAADYIEEQFARIGVEPLPGVDGFRQDFSYTAGVTDIGTVLTVRGVNGTEVRESNFDMAAVRALSFSDVGTADGPLVFAGYGLSVPETDGFSYDSYATLDVADKIVMVLRYFPEDTEGELRGTLARYAGLRYKAFAARERGAKGLIVVTGPRSPNPGQLVPLTFDNADDHDQLKQGAKLRVSGLHDALEAGTDIKVETEDGSTIACKHALSSRQIEILLAGGLINWMRDRT